VEKTGQCGAYGSILIVIIRIVFILFILVPVALFSILLFPVVVFLVFVIGSMLGCRMPDGEFALSHRYCACWQWLVAIVLVIFIIAIILVKLACFKGARKGL
jgi:hypothetical protein